MKLISYRTNRGPRIAGLRGNDIIDLHDADPALPSCPKALLSIGNAGRSGHAEKALASGQPVSEPVTWLPPIPSPEKIVCIGLNYADHARETNATIPTCPVVFSKFATALLPHDGIVRLPKASNEVDYEAELVLVIGRRGRHISEARPAATLLLILAATTFPPAIGKRTSRADNGFPARVSTPSRPCGPWMVTAERFPIRASSGSSSA